MLERIKDFRKWINLSKLDLQSPPEGHHFEEYMDLLASLKFFLLRVYLYSLAHKGRLTESIVLVWT